MSRDAYATGARVLIRDEEWLVVSSEPTERDGWKVEVLGQSELVRGTEATFFTALDEIEVLQPEDTELVAESSSRFVRSRLFLEAVLRRTPLPRTERGLAMVDDFMLEPMTYQQRPAELALRGLRPRILIADVVGLGKTLEIGLILAELIRRGRGDRILVVTPQHVLEQFQRELWTRFSIPLLRLDSVGISRIQQKLPAGRNPFTVHKRVIISVDTLKNPKNYQHHLENLEWDAVVIDESHNLIGQGNQNQRAMLAARLAPRTDALILASATPHNGDKQSFARLVDLLDPTAIADREDYSAADIADLYIRRTKNHPEVSDAIGGSWAPRGETTSLPVPATPAEEQVFAELTKTWFAGDASLVPTRRRLFPFTLLKSFLSSPRALIDTVDKRLRSLTAATREDTESADTSRETEALRVVKALAERVGEPAKLTALVDHLTGLGVGAGSPTRVVVFSERVATLSWLAETVGPRLGLKPEQVRVLHGGLSDVEQQKVVDEFALAASPVRLLFTGDIASEGVNLHRQCHQLVHYDIPWSLIRIEQRNGRIDRFGQTRPPQFAALLLESGIAGAKDDMLVARRILEREEEAHRALGTAETITATFDADAEEERLTRQLVSAPSMDEALDAVEREAHGDVLSALLAGPLPTDVPDEPQRAVAPRLFADTATFVETAVRELTPDVDFTKEGQTMLLTPPDDLRHRLSLLPPNYLKARKVLDRLAVTTDRDYAVERLDHARQKEKIAWPDVAYLSDLHPLTEWLVDKALLQLGRGKAPVILCDVTEPTYCLQGVYTNEAGQPAVVEWMAVTGLEQTPTVTDLMSTLDTAGVGPDMINPGGHPPLEPLRQRLPAAIAAARTHLEARRAVWDAEVGAEIDRRRADLDNWRQRAIDGLADTPGKTGRVHRIDTATRHQSDRIAKLRTSGTPLLRVLAVLAPLEPTS